MMWTKFSHVGQFFRRHKFAIKMLALISGLIVFMAVARMVPIEAPLGWLRRTADELDYWGPIAFVLTFVGLTVVLLPGWPLTVASGTMFGPIVGGLLSSIASTGAAAVSFLIGRYLARDWIATRIRRYPRLNAVYRTLGSDEGWQVFAAVRLSHSLPFGLQNFLLGLSPVRFGVYLLTTWLVTLPGIFFMAYLGHVAGGLTAADSPEVYGPWYWAVRAGGLAVAGCALFFLGRVAFRAIREHTELRSLS
jgi:uncharacterized membrane protein YdjX (TVP38/TMEM64 family)